MSRSMEYEEMRQLAAIEIAIDSKTLKRCWVHDDVLLEGEADVVAAYKLGEMRYTAGKMEGIFSSRREMTDCIQFVVDNFSALRCEQCADPD